MFFILTHHSIAVGNLTNTTASEGIEEGVKTLLSLLFSIGYV